jgi:hypothetical protein
MLFAGVPLDGSGHHFRRSPALMALLDLRASSNCNFEPTYILNFSLCRTFREMPSGEIKIGENSVDVCRRVSTHVCVMFVYMHELVRHECVCMYACICVLCVCMRV